MELRSLVYKKGCVKKENIVYNYGTSIGLVARSLRIKSLKVKIYRIYIEKGTFREREKT